jgi:hypothetical protein
VSGESERPKSGTRSPLYHMRPAWKQRRDGRWILRRVACHGSAVPSGRLPTPCWPFPHGRMDDGRVEDKIKNGYGGTLQLLRRVESILFEHTALATQYLSLAGGHTPLAVHEYK